MKNKKGFTLTEVLVALVIVAVGVLGHAKMQAKSMTIAQRANFMQSANSALLDLAQRIRASGQIAKHFEINNLSGQPITTSSNCITTTCTENEFAKAELAEWFSHLQNKLPSPSFEVKKTTTDPIKGDIYTIRLIWDAAKKGESSNTFDPTKVNAYQSGKLDIWIPASAAGV